MTFEKVRDLLASQLEISSDLIREDTDILEDLGADSLDLVELLTSLEDEFGIEVPDEDVEKFHTVGDVVRFIEANS